MRPVQILPPPQPPRTRGRRKKRSWLLSLLTFANGRSMGEWWYVGFSAAAEPHIPPFTHGPPVREGEQAQQPAALLAPPSGAWRLRWRQDLDWSHRNEIPGISCCLVC